MKRKFILLSLFGALTLTGCDFSFEDFSFKDRYVFKKKAAEILRDIEKHNSEEKTKSVTLSLKEKTDATGELEGKALHYVYESELSAEYSIEDVFYHYKTYTSAKTALDSETSETTSLNEGWGFIKDDKLCVATRKYTVSGGTTTDEKKYKYVEDYQQQFSYQILAINLIASAINDNKTYASQLADSFEGNPKDGVKYKSIWNFSKGAGCFKTRGRAELDNYDYSGVASTGTAKVRLIWENYALTKLILDANVKCKIKINGTEVDVQNKQRTEGFTKFSASKFSLDLSDFTLQE